MQCEEGCQRALQLFLLCSLKHVACPLWASSRVEMVNFMATPVLKPLSKPVLTVPTRGEWAGTPCNNCQAEIKRLGRNVFALMLFIPFWVSEQNPRSKKPLTSQPPEVSQQGWYVLTKDSCIRTEIFLYTLLGKPPHWTHHLSAAKCRLSL